MIAHCLYSFKNIELEKNNEKRIGAQIQPIEIDMIWRQPNAILEALKYEMSDSLSAHLAALEVQHTAKRCSEKMKKRDYNRIWVDQVSGKTVLGGVPKGG